MQKILEVKKWFITELFQSPGGGNVDFPRKDIEMRNIKFQSPRGGNVANWVMTSFTFKGFQSPREGNVGSEYGTKKS